METLLIVVLSGLGTFLLRFLPVWQARRRKVSGERVSTRFQGFLRGIGPAAITALLTVSLWPMMVADSATVSGRLAPIAALAVLYLIKQRTGGIAGPTLAAALVYGACVHFFG